MLSLAAYAAPVIAHSWHDVNFANRPLYAYPLPSGRDDLIGSLTTYRIQPGDTLLDVGRWFGLSAKEISDANGHMDWWLPPAGREVILPTEHILPDSPHSGIILNVPEMRLYYYFPSPAFAHTRASHKKGKLTPIALRGGSARVVYTFPVGLGRFDWKTPLGVWRVTEKVKNPIWVMPDDIYQTNENLTLPAVRALVQTPDGTVWAGADDGALYRCETNRLQAFRPKDALAHVIREIDEDRQDGKAQGRDREDLDELGGHVAVEHPQAADHRRLPLQRSRRAATRSRHPAPRAATRCRLRRRKNSTPIAVIARLAPHIAQNGDTIKASASVSPPISPM